MLTGHNVIASHCGHTATQEDLQWGHSATRQEEQQTLWHIHSIIGSIGIQFSPVDCVWKLSHNSAIIHIHKASFTDLLSDHSVCIANFVSRQQLKASKIVELGHYTVIASNIDLTVPAHSLQHIVNACLGNTTGLCKMLDTLCVLQAIIQNGHHIVNGLVLHISLHLVHTLGNITVKVTALKFTVINSKTRRNSLGADRILTPFVGRKRHIGTGSLEPRINALIVVGLHHWSLVISDPTISTHKVKQANGLQKFWFDCKADNGIDLALCGMVASQSLRRQLFQSCHGLVQNLGIHIGFLTRCESRKHLDNGRVLLDTSSINVGLSIGHIDFVNRAHYILPPSLLHTDNGQQAKTHICSLLNNLKVHLVTSCISGLSD